MIRVGFVLNLSGNGWLGGINYFRNLLKAVEALQSTAIKPVLFVGKDTDSRLLDSFPGFEIVRTSALDSKTPLWLIRGVLAKLLKRDVVLDHIIAQAGIDLLSHLTGTVPNVNIPSIGWIPDFQHIHYPEFCDEPEIKKRNNDLQRMIQFNDAIILSSRDAQKDFINLLSGKKKKSYVLNFAIAKNDSESESVGLEALTELYQINSKYFYLPNQFWAHKNHRVVIDALAILKKQGKQVFVVSSGNPSDHRNPSYFPGLMKYAHEKEVLDCFKVLGVVPFEHILPLMSHAIAVINPSLFEGWSTTVEEAKALGKKILLSDIDVHQEQSPERGSYFNPHEADALALLMTQTLDEFDANEEENHRSRAIGTHQEQFNQFGKAYERIVTEVMGCH